MSSCHHVIMPSCHHVIMSSCHHVIMSSCHLIMSSCHHVVMSSCHHVCSPAATCTGSWLPCWPPRTPASCSPPPAPTPTRALSRTSARSLNKLKIKLYSSTHTCLHCGLQTVALITQVRLLDCSKGCIHATVHL